MAYPTMNEAVSKVVLAAKEETVDALLKFLGDKIEIDEIKEFFIEFKNNLKEPSKKSSKKSDSNDESKKKAPSAYNLFIKDMSPVLKEKNPNAKGKELMALASAEWKNSEYAAFLKKKIKEMQEEDKTVVYEIETLYKIAKEIYEEKNCKKN